VATKDEIAGSFDRIARLPRQGRWDHNNHYHPYLLRHLPAAVRMALDVGCGTGELTGLLAKRVGYVIGLDLSPAMIEEAAKRNPASNITYMRADFDEFTSRDLGAVCSVAAFHHLDLEKALPRIARLLAPGGVLLLLDLYKRKGLADRLLDLLAVPANLVLSLVRNGRLSQSAAEREVWRDHGRLDKLMTFSELRSLYERHLPGTTLRRHLFWRYSAVYRKPAAT